MLNSKGLSEKLRLRYGASLTAIAFALAATGTAVADEATPPEKAKGEIKVAQASDAPPPPDANPQKVEKVTVTGFRRALRSALDQKKNSNTQIDVVKAEDVAKFPDLNLSESLQRIPGVSISRDAGEGRQITVRGLGPQFTRIRINGMEALSTAGGTDAAGGTNRTRSFDFNVFAADLFQNMTIRKTPAAETEEGSLGATVDLRAARPFDFDGFTAAASAAYGWNDLSESFDPRATALVSWENDTFGALFSVAYSDRETMEAGASTVRWQNDGATINPQTGLFVGGAANARFGTENVAAYTLTQLNQAFRPRIPRYDIYEHEQTRLGMTGSLQWRPGENTTVSLDAMYSKVESGRNEIFLEAPVFSTTGAAGIQDVDVVDAVIQNNSIVYGVFNDVDIRSEFRHDDLSTEYKQATLEIDHLVSDVFKLNLLGGYAESDHQNPVQTTLLFDANNVDGYSYDFRGNSRLPIITYGTADVTNPATWTLTQIRLRPQTALNTYTSVHGGGEWDAFDWLSVKGGVDWKRYEFETTELRRDGTQFAGSTVPGCTAGAAPTIISNAEGCLPANVLATAVSSISRLVTLSDDGLDIPGGNVGTWLIPNLDAAAQMWDLYNTARFPLRFEPALGNNAAVEEEGKGAYLQGDFAFENAPLRGNIGMRYVQTDQRSTGFTFKPAIPDNAATPQNEAVPASVVKTTVGREYEDWLPSANIVFEPLDDFLIRFGLSKVMSRAGLANLTPGATLSVSGSNRTVTAGNPNLDPFRAENFDMSVEWYPQPGALVGFALFHKNITSFSFTLRNDMPFTGNPLGLPDELAAAACGGQAGCSAASLWQFNIPTNTNGGEVSGVEFNWQQPFTFLPAPFDNLGTMLNYTYVESDIDYLGTVVNPDGTVSIVSQVKADLLNLSRNAYNATLYYDDPTWSARVSAAYRGRYLTTIPGRNGNFSESTAGTLNIDFQVSYAIDDNFKVTLEGLNMTDEVNDQYLSPDDRMSFYHNFGRQFFLGVRYTY